MAKKTLPPYPALYDALEVHPKARPAVIEAAYRALRDDLQQQDTEESDTLLERAMLYRDTLLDSTSRRKYDKLVVELEGTIVGNYRILHAIATGGFATTYLAENMVIGEKVCIKHCHGVEKLHEEILIEEARSIWDLRHYALPVMRDFIRFEDGSLGLVMSYIAGPTLEEYTLRQKRLRPETVAWLGERILYALKYIHLHGVIHADVKPHNVIVQPEIHAAVLVDFGLSVVKPTAKSEWRGHTEVFAAPEQIQGKPLLPESDLYSLGMTLLYALSGDIKAVQRMEAPDDVPVPLLLFIRDLVAYEVTDRPHWGKVGEKDLCDRLRDVRMECFGRISSALEQD